MKRVVLLILLLVVVGFGGLSALKFVKEKVHKDLSVPITYPSVTPLPSAKQNEAGQTGDVHTALFVPYWTTSDDSFIDSYDEFIYFGIAPSSERIDTKDIGFLRVDDFLKIVPQNAKKLLTVRMTDTPKNLLVLKNQKNQKKIIGESISFAKDNGFDGIVLDLEVSAIPFDSLIKQINTFTELFYTEVKKNNLTLSLTLYGDTFYRIRPFEVKTLAKNADRILLMAYDFHKSKGNPGPNFPLRGGELYGYDMLKMIDDFLKFIPPQKITVVFGMFGYDWTVDNQGKSAGAASPLTLLEIKKGFLTDCPYKNCIMQRDRQSSETEISYMDEDNKKHIIWFEDMESVAMKEQFLRERGISHFSFWAHSYF